VHLAEKSGCNTVLRFLQACEETDSFCTVPKKLSAVDIFSMTIFRDSTWDMRCAQYIVPTYVRSPPVLKPRVGCSGAGGRTGACDSKV
jgi:hypothetical protein